MSRPTKSPRTTRLEQTITAVQRRHGSAALQSGATRAGAATPRMRSGIPALDALTGCNGLPLGALCLFSGAPGSGQIRAAYHALAQAQRLDAGGRVAVLEDVRRAADPLALARCGVNLKRLAILQPPSPAAAVEWLGDALRSAEVRAVLVDDLAALTQDVRASRQFESALPQLLAAVRASRALLIVLDEARSAVSRWLGFGSPAVAQNAALHLSFKFETWLHRGGAITAYRTQVTLERSRWAPRGARAALEFPNALP